MHAVQLLTLLIGCSNDVAGKPDGPVFDQDSGSGTVDSGPDVDGTCDTPPSGGTTSRDTACMYAPSAGGAFSPRVEWSMAHGVVDPATGAALDAYAFSYLPEMTGVFQAPAVGQATDDNGNGQITPGDIPDIAVLMGVEPEPDIADELGVTEPRTWSVLRLISGDGRKVHASVDWLPWGNQQVAPFLYAGVAMADVDADGRMEIATLVTRESDGACFPALYEVAWTGDVTLDSVGDTAVWCQQNTGWDGYRGAHAPALADLDADGGVEVIFGRQVFAADTLALRWAGTSGRGNFNTLEHGASGYWNSGYHAFAYDMDGDGVDMEVVAGRTVYRNDGSVYCELGRNGSGGWVAADDGYAAVADVARFSGDMLGEPEIVLTGNQYVSVYRGMPDSSGHCVEFGRVANNPYATTLGDQLPAHPNCNTSRRAFGGQPTIADFSGDGTRDVAVSGACWYTVFDVTAGGLTPYAITPTRDWSSASTGSTVFDFNGDGVNEVVYADEEALHVWQIDTTPGLEPWERLQPVLTDANHGSWTIHEYPLVADLDGDGKAEILVSNAPRFDAATTTVHTEYGLYALGAADDDWVSARQSWSQHAYYVTNIEDDGTVGYATPNYAPFSGANLNSFRLQAPGAYGSKVAPDLVATVDTCREGCDSPLQVWVSVANQGAYVTAGAGTKVSLYGEQGGVRTLLGSQDLPRDATPGDILPALVFEVVDPSAFDRLVAVVDDPAAGSGSESWGSAKECDERNNEVVVQVSGDCP
jgi:hypothetical protein